MAAHSNIFILISTLHKSMDFVLDEYCAITNPINFPNTGLQIEDFPAESELVPTWPSFNTFFYSNVGHENSYF